MFSQTLFEVLKEQLLKKEIAAVYDGKQSVSISYDDRSRSYIEKMIGDFSKLEDYSLLLLKQEDHCNFTIQMKKEDEPISDLFNSVLESFEQYDEEKNYYNDLDPMSQGMCNVFRNVLSLSGNFGIGVRTINDTKKFTIKTDISDCLEAMEKLGFSAADQRVIIRENGSEVPVEVTFQQIVQNLTSSKEKKVTTSMEESSLNRIIDSELNSVVNEFQVQEELLDMDGEIELLEENGPKMMKSLGSMPSSNKGISSWIGLGFFLLLDIVAIGLGIYLLMQ